MAKAEDHGLGLVEIDHRVAVIMQTRERDNRYHLWLQYWDPAVGAPQDSVHLTVTPGIYYLRLATPLAGGGLALLGHHGEGAFELSTFGADGMQTGRFLPPPETNGQLQDVWHLPDGQLLLQSRSSIGTNISVYAYEQQLYKIGEGITWRGNLAGTAQAEIRDLRKHADGTYTVCGSLSDSAWLATYRGTKPLRQRTLGAAARSYDMEVRYGVIKNLLPVRQDTLYTIAAYAGLASDVRLALDADWSPISDTLLPLVFGEERSERVANGSVYTIETGFLEPHGLKRTELFSAGDTFVRSYWQGAEGELRDLLVLNDTILVLQEHTTKTSQRTNLTALSADLRTEYWHETVGRPLRKSYSRFSSVAGQAIAFYRPATSASGESDLHVLRQPEGVPEKVELPDWAQAAHLLATEGDTLTLLLTDLRGQAEVWWTLAGRPVQRIRIDGLGDHRRREELYSYQDGQLYLLTTMDRRGDSLDLTAMVEQGLTFGDLLKPIPVLTQIDLRTGRQMRTVLQDLLDVRVRSLDLSGPLALISGRLLSNHETICAVYNLREKRIATYTIPTPQGELA
ncbi:MAG: hypothetical protein WA952_08730, partial [Lewinella sp.]